MKLSFNVDVEDIIYAIIQELPEEKIARIADRLGQHLQDMDMARQKLSTKDVLWPPTPINKVRYVSDIFNEAVFRIEQAEQCMGHDKYESEGPVAKARAMFITKCHHISKTYFYPEA